MVSFAVETVGWDDGGGGGVVTGAEGEAESGTEQGAGGGGLAAVSVNDPQAGSRAVAAHGSHQEVVGVHRMDYQGLAEAGGKACMEVEDGLLCGDVAASQAVEAALADGYCAARRVWRQMGWSVSQGCIPTLYVPPGCMGSPGRMLTTAVPVQARDVSCGWMSVYRSRGRVMAQGRSRCLPRDGNAAGAGR